MILDVSRSGHGEPLVLIHGLGSARTIWKPLSKLLNNSFDIIAVDLPGHGTSSLTRDTKMAPMDLADHVRQTLDSLDVDKAHIVGNSLGGWTALEFAAAFPERTLSVTGLAPAGMRERPLIKADWRLKVNRRLALTVRPFIPVMVSVRPLRAIGFAHNSPRWRCWSKEVCRDAAWAMASATGYDLALAGTFHRVADCTSRIPVSVPVTIIFGDSDNTLPPHTSQTRRYLPPHAVWQTWPQCGHAIQLDYPDKVADLIRGHL